MSVTEALRGITGETPAGERIPESSHCDSATLDDIDRAIDQTIAFWCDVPNRLLGREMNYLAGYMTGDDGCEDHWCRNCGTGRLCIPD